MDQVQHFRLQCPCRVDIEAWGSLAESASQQLGKGAQVAVQGRLKQDKWTDKSGQTRTRLKVRCNIDLDSSLCCSWCQLQFAQSNLLFVPACVHAPRIPGQLWVQKQQGHAHFS